MKTIELNETLRDADALLVVPPSAGVDRPCLGVHVLQACAAEAGFDVQVLYANMLFAREIGEELSQQICYAQILELVAERVFSEAAFGAGRPPRSDVFCNLPTLPGCKPIEELVELIPSLSRTAAAWADELARAIGTFDIPVIGCTSTFEQTAAAFALLNRIKLARPGTVTIMGGANCEGEMAEGLLALGQRVDHFFSGESETTFPQFLRDRRSGKQQPAIISGTPCLEMDALPTPDFGDYVQQLERFLPDSAVRSEGQLTLMYESSRGCWWGQKHHCTFCGLNGEGMGYRSKRPERVLSDLKQIADRSGICKISMTDNIMPNEYFKTLLPMLAESDLELDLFYETKSNLSFDQLHLFRRAGISAIQPGIEALSTPVLRLMDKGVTASQNVAALRFARAEGMDVGWSILCGFPGDAEQHYEQVIELVPLLEHLPPPMAVYPIIINRFSPYHVRPERYGIADMTPAPAYQAVFPEGAPIHRIAYYFDGSFASAARRRPAVVERLRELVGAWRSTWDGSSSPPELSIARQQDAPAGPVSRRELLQLTDTRTSAGERGQRLISVQQAVVALFGARAQSPLVDWAVSLGLCAALDSRFTPLATAQYDLYRDLQRFARPDAPSTRLLPVVPSDTAAGH